MLEICKEGEGVQTKWDKLSAACNLAGACALLRLWSRETLTQLMAFGQIVKILFSSHRLCRLMCGDGCASPSLGQLVAGFAPGAGSALTL